MERADVNGTDTQPTYVFLKNALRGKIAWNFTKFVIGRDGNVLARFGQDVKPDQLEKNKPFCNLTSCKKCAQNHVSFDTTTSQNQSNSQYWPVD